ncbi:MAG: hypothetical protein R3A10_13920 [Caldilineaceae bacterium]
MATFSEQLRVHRKRAGISDAPNLAQHRRATPDRLPLEGGHRRAAAPARTCCAAAAKLRRRAEAATVCWWPPALPRKTTAWPSFKSAPQLQTAATGARHSRRHGRRTGAVAAHLFAPVPWPLWGLVGGFFVLIIALAMGWIRPAAPW